MGGGGVAGSPPAKGARGDSQLQGLPLPPWESGWPGWAPGTVESRPRGRAAADDRDSGWAGSQGRGADQRRGYLVLEAHLPGGAVRREATEAGRDVGRGARGDVRGVAQHSLPRSQAQRARPLSHPRRRHCRHPHRRLQGAPRARAGGPAPARQASILILALDLESMLEKVNE